MEGALGKGVLRARVREQIAIAVAQENGCDYCLSAHTAIGKMIGVSESQLAGARAGKSGDAKVDAMLTLAVQILRERGRISATELADAEAAGLTNAEVVEIVGAVALNIFTNYLNIAADTEIDFPVLRTAELAPA
jgi:AhpD family alkylhydroperoxidase